MSAGPLVVTYPLTGRSRAIVAEELGGTAEAIYLVDLAPADRAHALGRAGAVHPQGDQHGHIEMIREQLAGLDRDFVAAIDQSHAFALKADERNLG